MEFLKDIIRNLDKLLVGTLLERHFFINEKARNQIIKELKKEANVRIKNTTDKHLKKLYEEILHFDYSSKDIAKYESIFNDFCNLLPKYPIEYWSLKSTQAQSPEPFATRKILSDTFQERTL